MSRLCCPVLLMLFVFVGSFACQPATIPVTAIPISRDTPAISESPVPTRIKATVTPSPSVKIQEAPSVLIREQMGPLYEVVLTIPLGKDGVSYRGTDNPNMEITGPNALAILPDGEFIVADLIGNRLLEYDTSGKLLKAIDLQALGIMNISDLTITEAGIFLLEIFLGPGPQAYKVHQLSFEGDIKASYEIPRGFHLENGLSGIAISNQEQIFIELEGAARLYQLGKEPGTKPVRVTGYSFYGKTYELHSPVIGGPAWVHVNDIKLETELSHGLGGLSFLKAFPDGSFYLIRDDVVNDRVIQVDQTVHYIHSDGSQQGVARVPLTEYYYPVRRNLAVGPDGNVFGLLPRPDSLKIIRMNFYQSMEPLIPEAVEPVMTRSGK